MGDADGSEEAISGEEMQSYVDDLAHELLEIGSPEMGICIWSLDVKALYPSLIIKTCARIAKERFIKSKLQIEEVDITWALIYVALTN